MSDRSDPDPYDRGHAPDCPRHPDRMADRCATCGAVLDSKKRCPNADRPVHGPRKA